MSESKSRLMLPPSAVGWFDAIFTLPVIVGVFLWLRSLPESVLSDTQLAMILVALLGLVMGAIEIRRAPWRELPPSSDPWSTIAGRAIFKLMGFYAALTGVILLYWLFPEYERAYYERFFEAARQILPILPILTVPYFLYVEWRLPYKEDGTWHMALFTAGEWRRVDWNELSQYALGWLVKGFFLPIMFTDIARHIGKYRDVGMELFSEGFLSFFQITFSGMIYLELVFVSAGYIFALRLFDSQIRAVEKTLFGWVVAVISYSPFLHLIYVRYLDYSIAGGGWITWLEGHPTIMVVWGTLILLLVLLHLWSDACFGVRFSNLTHRGIITNGPYRFSKHPAYIIKNIRWWMVSVPFIAVSWHEAIRLSLLLVLVNLLYTTRAYAEERMLSQDPTYIAYGRWMDRHGIFAFVGRKLPFLSYEWRLRYWQDKGYITNI